MSHRFDAGGCPIVALPDVMYLRCALRVTEARWSIDQSCISEKIAPSFRLQMETFFSSSLRVSRFWSPDIFPPAAVAITEMRPSVRSFVRSFGQRCPLKKSMPAKRRNLLAKVARNWDAYIYIYMRNTKARAVDRASTSRSDCGFNKSRLFFV